MNSWFNVILPVIGTLLGVLIGGWITTRAKRLELKFQAEREQKKLILGKIEQIHTQALEYMFEVTKYDDFVNDFRSKNEFESRSFAIHIIESLRTIAAIETLVDIYTPSLSDIWGSVNDEIGNFHDMAYIHLKEKTISNKEVNEASQRVLEKIGTFLKQVVELSRKYSEVESPSTQLTTKP